MTLLEAEDIASKLSTINLAIWDATSRAQKKILKKQFRDAYSSVIAAGFKIQGSKRWSDEHNRRIPCFKAFPNKHRDCIEIVNNRSSNAKYVGDCSTRTLCFCTNAEYNAMQQKQFALSRRYGCSWKNTYVISKILEDDGYVSMRLPRRISRATFIRLFKDEATSGIIASLSSGHIAAIDMAQGKVLDTWDSTGGLIYTIYVPASQSMLWNRKIAAILG